jgi:hypothetical protein
MNAACPTTTTTTSATATTTTSTTATTTTSATATTTTSATATTTTAGPTFCGGGFCGAVTAAESLTQNLGYIPIELRSAKGAVLQTVLTSTGTYPNNNYSFPGSGLSGSYFVAPALGRGESSSPSQFGPVPVGAAVVNFSVRGVPGAIQAIGSAGTFVLITTNTWNQSSPPASGGGQANWSSTIGLDGQITFNIPGGNYYMTCWTPITCGNQIKYVPVYNTNTLNQITVVPQGATVTVTCPSPSCPN